MECGLKKSLSELFLKKFQKLALVLLTYRDQLRNDLLSFVCQIILLYESCIYIFFPHIYLIFHWIILDAMHFFLFLKFLFGINEFYFWSFLFFWMKTQLCGRITQPNRRKTNTWRRCDISEQIHLFFKVLLKKTLLK